MKKTLLFAATMALMASCCQNKCKCDCGCDACKNCENKTEAAANLKGVATNSAALAQRLWLRL